MFGSDSTCVVLRRLYIDLDIVPNLTTSAFFRSFKQFTAHCGLPQKLISNNAKTFVAAAEMIKATTVNEEVQGYLVGAGVEWQFNLEKVPRWGGNFERVVKSTKRNSGLSKTELWRIYFIFHQMTLKNP